MKVGLVGFAGSGKTTLFNTLTGLAAEVGGYGAKEKANIGVIKVPDTRVDELARPLRDAECLQAPHQYGRDETSR